MKKIIIAVSIVSMMLTGCWSGNKNIVEKAMESMSAPVMLEASKGSKSVEPLIEAAITVVDDLQTVKDPDTVIAVITVPSYTIKASTTDTFVPATTIQVSKPHKSWKNTIIPTKNDKKKDVVVIADKKVIVEVPEITPWWYYAIGLFLALVAIYVLIQKYIGLCSKSIEWITRIFSWLR